MKKIYLLFIMLPMLGFSQGNFQIGTHFGTYSPFKNQMPKMGTVYGMGFNASYKPFMNIPVAIDWTNHFGTYYNRTMQETYYFNETSSTTTDVTYTSKMRTNLLGLKVDLTNEYSAVRPYITPQIGWSTLKSKIYIADPNDVDDCQPLDRRTNHIFRGTVYGGEVGLQVDMNKLFKGIGTENTHFLYISGSYLRGFQMFEYINQKHMQQHEHGVHQDGTIEGEDGRALTTQFVNVTTNEIHEHKIAEVYNTPYEMWGLKIGYVINF